MALLKAVRLVNGRRTGGEKFLDVTNHLDPRITLVFAAFSDTNPLPSPRHTVLEYMPICYFSSVSTGLDTRLFLFPCISISAFMCVLVECQATLQYLQESVLGFVCFSCSFCYFSRSLEQMLVKHTSQLDCNHTSLCVL